MNEQEQYWYDHVTKQQASDQSITGYCKERNISRSTFAKMRDRLDLGQPKNEVRRSGFISIVLVLSSGVEIKFNHTPDHLWLSKLIVELG
jgi:hypothetical protein